MTAAPSSSREHTATGAKQPEAGAAQEEDEEDDLDLDALLDRYSQEAARAVQRAEAKAKQPGGKGRQQRSMVAVRDEGLAQPLGRQNKGFQMLRAMGYVEGGGLGE